MLSRRVLLRWITNKSTSKKPKGGIYTPTAAMGVRGTDFQVIVNPLLGETEIVVLNGKVIFQSLKSFDDKRELTDGQWGGLGGRFGSEIGEILDLPKNVLDFFDSQLKY